jgi:PEP-CTERM motif
MKTQKIILSGLVALSLAAISVQAAVLPGSDIGGLNVNGSQPGDLVLGFRNASSSSDLAVDIGQFSAYEGVAAGTYTVGGFNAAELTTVFPTAFTAAGTQWTVFGGTGNNSLAQPDSTLWATSNSTLNKQSVGIQGSLSNTFDTFVNTGLGVSSFGGTSDANQLSAPKLFSNLGSATSYSGFFGSPVESTTLGSNSLKLWELTPGSGAGTLLGTFNLDASSGLLTFTVGTAIPEPSTYAALLGVVTLGIVAIRRRRQASIEV